MIQVQNLSKQYAGQVLFEKASFLIGSGEKVGLVGRNGTGKTTLIKILRGLENYDGGEIAIPRNYQIGALDQHIHFSKDTLLDEVTQVLRDEEEHDTYKAEKILMGLGFTTKDFLRPPGHFSGGFQVRINLAKALLQRPSLLLLDEPTNYLDIVSMSWLKKFLRQYSGEVMLITHDRQFMDEVVTHVMGIHRKGIKKFQGDTGHFYQRILEEEELHEKTRQNLEKKRKELMTFISRFKAKASKASQAQSKAKQLERMGKLDQLRDEANLSFAFNYKECPAKMLMTFQNISFSYEQKAESDLFKNLSFSIAAQDRIGVVGKNGKGKSTLLNVIAGELSPRTGTIHSHPSLRVGFFGQTNIQRLNLENTIIQEIATANSEITMQRIRNICGTMMFDGDMAKKKVEIISGGERARVMLGKILACPTNLLLLDEPTNHLDMQSIQSLVTEIDDYPGALMVVTHNEMLLHAFAEKLIVFGDNGAEMFLGTYQEFLDKIGWDEESKETSEKKQGSSFKHQKMQRSEIILERAKILLPLKTEIEELEKKISEHEEMSKKIEVKLLNAYAENKASLIQEFSPLAGKLKVRVEELYSRLELAHDELSLQEEHYRNLLGE
ncbi:MAG: ABC-F family ATP-binding cassette domain-containing protein [Bdellovibrionota bacterium]